MVQGADLVLKLCEPAAGVGIVECLEPVLVRVGFLGDQPARIQSAVRAREVGHVDGDVMTVVGGTLGGVCTTTGADCVTT